jgi:hypothetical protein
MEYESYTSCIPKDKSQKEIYVLDKHKSNMGGERAK